MGAWIEIELIAKQQEMLASHPTMGAWIEIRSNMNIARSKLSRTPRWVRGLKYHLNGRRLPQTMRRTPRWVRGLKS